MKRGKQVTNEQWKGSQALRGSGKTVQTTPVPQQMLEDLRSHTLQTGCYPVAKLCLTLQPNGSHHARWTDLLCPSPSPRVCPPSWIIALSWQRGLPNSVELWAMPCRATQDRRVIVESSAKMRSPGGGNSKPLQWTCLENSKNCVK